MAGWNTNPSWNSLESINEGFKFTSISDISPSDFNKLVENMHFLYTNYLNSEGGELDMKRIYPVGSIYLSLVKDSSPAEQFGGTWERLKDRFLLGAGDTYAFGTEGGRATHTIIDSNLPLGSICVSTNTSGTDKYNGGATWTLKTWNNGDYIVTTRSIASTMNSALKSAEPISNMPPYLAVYMWKRTA